MPESSTWKETGFAAARPRSAFSQVNWRVLDGVRWCQKRLGRADSGKRRQLASGTTPSGAFTGMNEASGWPQTAPAKASTRPEESTQNAVAELVPTGNDQPPASNAIQSDEAPRMRQRRASSAPAGIMNEQVSFVLASETAYPLSTSSAVMPTSTPPDRNSTIPLFCSWFVGLVAA